MGSSPSYETLTYELEEHVAEIALDRPDKHNPLGELASEELIDALERAHDDEAVHAVLLMGRGESFSAGGDISEFVEYDEKHTTDVYEEGAATADLFKLLARYEKPLVGAINGDAYGGGVGLAAACHISYASRDASFRVAEVTLGLFPLVILPALRNALGDGKTLELALTARPIDAEEGADIGLVTDVVDSDAVLKTARETAHDIADWSPLATSLGLHAFVETGGMPPEQAIDALRAYRVVFYKSHDFNEGARAFLEDRNPEWAGY